MFEFAGRRVVDLHNSARPAECHELLIWTDVGGEDRVGLITDLGQAFAGGDIKQHDLARFRAVSASGEQQLAVAAELQHIRNPFGERQRADQLQIVGVVEQDLLLACDRR